VFAADFTILVAVAIVETCLAHADSIVPTAESFLPPGPNGNQTTLAKWHHPDDEG
jgi:hypothetical protein